MRRSTEKYRERKFRLTTSFSFDTFLSLKIVKERRDSLVRGIAGFLLIFPFLQHVSEATPNLHNPRGLFRVLRAGTHAKGDLLFSLEGEVLKYSVTPSLSYAFIPYYVPWRIGRLDLSYTPIDHLEIYGIGVGIQEKIQTIGEPHRSGFGDLEMGMKLGAMKKNWIQLGGMGYGIFPAGEEDFSNDYFQWGGRGLVTLELDPLHFNGNMGYHGNPGGRGDRLLLGLGIQLPTSLFSPMIEFTTEQDLGNPFFENPLRFSTGLRFRSPFGPVFDFGYDVNLTKEEEGYSPYPSLDWSLLLGVQFETSLHLFSPKTGTIMGKVMDSKTGEPLEATLLILREKGGGVLCDSKSGSYTLPKVLPGLKTIEVTSLGYRKKLLPVLVKKGEITIRDIPLEKTEEEE